MEQSLILTLNGQILRLTPSRIVHEPEQEEVKEIEVEQDEEVNEAASSMVI